MNLYKIKLEVIGSEFHVAGTDMINALERCKEKFVHPIESITLVEKRIERFCEGGEEHG